MAVPDNVLNAIAEYSPCGFILFCADSEGAPQAYLFNDSTLSKLALQSFGLKYLAEQEEIVRAQLENLLKPDNSEEES